ncbi:MAG TPA: SDR family NAD(P)-dependent oxidoreductase [Acidimicrobiales bacterium]|nr:SDR family NAD(P)-dependent oxidoreductase [Acidimicrobiales bacterium]
MPNEVQRARERDLIWVETPFEEPTAKVVVAASRAGAFGILDLGVDTDRALQALATVTRRTDAPFGVRVGEHCRLGSDDLPAAVDTVVLADHTLVGDWRHATLARIVVEVRSADEARAALAAGADGLVARGAESGGRVGTTGAFVLGQQVRELLADTGDDDRPLWVQGGIGRHTAAAAIVGGATGVVLDAQVALLRESHLPRAVRQAVAAMDGSETRVVGDHRLYSRPDLWVADLDARTTAGDLAGRLGATSLTEQAVPAGQDAAFAARFAQRYGTVGRMVTGLRQEIEDHIRAARTEEPLKPGNGVAPELGTTYPVVQGPMTRVSDRAAFAGKVAEGGGMPFLALALLRGESEVRPLLEETKELLGERPWGVGVLGFVPKELRDEQLSVIRDVRPPLALIAGGRPSQAVTLEEVGIRTFLHVPAPGLLERFLKDGARRFVFEGFECGGHTGPRSSYALWESQIEVLTEWAAQTGKGRMDDLDLLFAGGIHDERSAAMIAALTGPLAAAGARVGVLMGTAYLFTEEAVAGGAIGEEFQAQALACERTALLESGPGHVTRCAESPFVDTFEQTRRRLVDEGADHQVVWAELEGLNLGRLRVASKGLKRDGDVIVAVDRDEQRDEGMFMIGDVATLRSERTTVHDLHEAVTTGATAHLAAVAEQLDVAGLAHPRPVPQPVDVAIVGMAAVMPGADDVEEFWRNIVEGVNSITEVPPERWDVDTYFDPEWDHQTASQRDGSASKWGGFLREIAFDALAYGIPPASLAAIEPVQLLSLKIAADALTDAGYDDRPFDRENTSVVFGAEGSTDQSAASGFRAMYPSYMGEIPPELDEWLPHVTEDSFAGLLPNVIAGRIANRLDLGGRNLTVDAACASSLAAVDVACSELAAGSANVVLCGGADLHNGIQDFLLFTSVHALSTTGQCRTFDSSADGIALGEGVACVVLKRLADAERDGDRVYAVIRSVGASSDGRHLGLTAPRQEGQERALRRAYAQAQIDPQDVGLVEAHGTGTVVGDRTELSTLTQVFTQAGMATASCVVGSVKSNVGHTKCAAGLAGLIKAAKAVYHGVLPPTLNVEQPNQAWDQATSPFVFLDESRPWTDERRIAGVSAFGFGGTNFHVVIESHPDDDVPARAVDSWPAELFVFRGEQPVVDKALADLAARLDEPGAVRHAWRFRDIAAAVSGSGRGAVKVAIVASDADDLRAKVERARAGTTAPGVYLPDPALVGADDRETPRVAFLFPGQGSQRPGMAGDLLVGFAETRPLLQLGERWAATMLPPAAFGADARDAQQQAVTDTRVAQPTLGVAGLTAARVLARFGVEPDMLAGHSYGELVALCLSGAFDERTLLELSEARGEAMLAAVPDGDAGGMVAVSASRARLDEVLAGVDVVVANDNHPEQLVIAGPTSAVEESLRRLKEARITCRRLPVACAFHSPVVAAAAETLARRLEEAPLSAPELPVYSNLSADLYPSDVAKLRDLLSSQVANGVRFTEEVRAMYAAGARVFVEVGPGRTLTGCVDKILADRPHVAVATDRPGDSGVTALLHALARLAVAGVVVDVAELFEGRSVEPALWSKPGRPAGWTVSGHLVRQADGETVPGGLKPATSVPEIVLAAPANGDGNGHAPASDQVLVEYFKAAQQIIGAGHQLVMNHLGIAPTQAASVVAVPAIPAVPPVAPAPALTPAPAALADAERTAVAGEAEKKGKPLPSPEEMLAKLTAIVSGRTGYPEDMLGPDLDVEADLSIDSIKRLEILSELADEIGMSDDGNLDAFEDLVAELASRKTLRGIVDFLFEHADLLGGGEEAAAPAAAPVPAGRKPLPSPEEMLVRLTTIVSGRTGYPEDMLGPDLDVEADLSIDSIKRLEILSELADEIGMSDDGNLDAFEDLVAELASRKTLRGIVDFLFEHVDLLGGEAPAGSPVEADEEESDEEESDEIPSGANRFVVTLDDQPLEQTRDLAGLEVLVTGTSPVARAIADELGGRGADAQVQADAVAYRGSAGIVVLTDLLDGVARNAAGPEAVIEIPELYARVRALLLDTASDIVVVTPLGGGLGIDPPSPLRPGHGPAADPPDALPVGAGVRGLVKTAWLEFDRRVRLVDVDPLALAAELATVLADEVAQRFAPVEVAWHDGVRRASRIGVRPEIPAGSELPLGPDSVVLLTGGARGITARVALALAQRSGCRVELAGRSPLPEGVEDPDIAACTERVSLRAALIRAGWREPKAIEGECDRILAAREVRATLAGLAAAGSGVEYHQVDVRDTAALEAVVDSIYARHGRLDGVVHGAGILDDHFIVDKTPEAFERVFATKVDGARTVLRTVRRAVTAGDRSRPAFVVFFGSTAGVCGNRGQADYAAANDALDAMAAANRDVADSIFALDWGPWSSEAGMVSDALAAIFRSAGMGLIQVDDGTAVMLDEIGAAIATGDYSRPHQVTVARCAPALIAAAFGQGSGQGV